MQAAERDATNFATLMQGLYQIRRGKGLTQQDVAIRMGTTQSAVSDLERTAGDPHISTLQRYARAVGVELKFMTVAGGDRWESTDAVSVPVSTNVVSRTHSNRPVIVEKIEQVGA